MTSYSGEIQITPSTFISTLETSEMKGIDCVLMGDITSYIETVEEPAPLDAVLVAPEESTTNIYYKMVGRDSGLPGKQYVSWVVKNAPDYSGSQAPSTTGSLVDIYVSGIK